MSALIAPVSPAMESARPNGDTVLLDWAYPGEAPPAWELAWYLALNRSRLPESKEATIDRYRRKYQGEGREMGTLVFSEQQLEMLGPRAALVRGRWHLKSSSTESGGLFTLIFRKFDDGWKIVHDHTGAE